MKLKTIYQKLKQRLTELKAKRAARRAKKENTRSTKERVQDWFSQTGILKRLDNYIIKKYLGTFFLSIVLIISIAVVIDISEKLDEFFDNEAPLVEIVFDYYLNFIPYFANLFTPLFAFISVIFFTSKMAYNSEIIAILSCGVSFKRMLRPYIIASVIIGSLSFILAGYIIPPANKVRLEFEDKYIKSNKVDIVRNVQMEIEPNMILYMERFEQAYNRGSHLSLEKFDGKKLISRTTAQTIIFNADSVGANAPLWTLKDYTTRTFDGLYEDVKVGETMDTTLNIMPDELFITATMAPEMTNIALRKHISSLKKRGSGNVKPFQEELQKRFANPFAALILMIIGVSLSCEKKRGGIGLNLGIGLALSAFYVLFTTVSSMFALKGNMPLWVAVWLPNITYTILAVVLYIKTPK